MGKRKPYLMILGLGMIIAMTAACTNSNSTASPSKEPDIKITAFPSQEPDIETTASPSKQPDNNTTAIPTEEPNVQKVTETIPENAHETSLTLKDVYEDYFIIGAAINGSSAQTAAINHEGMSEILLKEFNGSSVSNLMKPGYLLNERLSKNSPDGMPVCSFESCEKILAYCYEHGIKLRGHTLVWHVQTPEWFFHEEYDETKPMVNKETMSLRLESYIKQVLTYCQTNYPGVIYCWDVVNEAVLDNGTWRMDSNWYRIFGKDYIEEAFSYARKYADQGVSLIYNDYNVFLPRKRMQIFLLANELKQKGLIDGLGLQPTVGLYTPELDTEDAGSFKKCLELYASLGLELQVTELSFLIDEDKYARNEETLKQQADRYYEMMQLLLKEDDSNGGPCNITSVTVFGICDDYPLYDDTRQCLYLWDGECKKKECYYSFLQAGLDWRANNRNE